MIGRRGLAASVAVATIVAGCLGTAATPAPTPSPEPLPTPVVTDYPLNAMVWEQGLVLTFHRATASLDAKGGPVTVTASIANPGAATATLDAPIQLGITEDIFDVVPGTALPDIAAGSSVDVSIEFDVVGHASVDDGVLRVGRPGDHAALVPFRPGSVAALSLEPKAADLKGSVTAGSVKLTLRHREVRWDLSDWYDELPLGTEALTLTYDVTNSGTFSGGLAFTAANVSLRLPTGTILAPRGDGQSQSIELIGPGKTVRNLFSRFEIPTAMTGTFALVVNDGAGKPRPLSFTIAP